MKKVFLIFLCAILIFYTGCSLDDKQSGTSTVQNPVGDTTLAEYIHLNNTGTYSTKIITDELLNKSTTLPTPTNSALPLWRGAGLTSKHSTDYTDLGHKGDRNFHESDIAFLSQSGFNFVRVQLNFSTLQYPDYPEDDTLINKSELIALDELLAWCIKYDIHLNLDMHGIPGRAEIGYFNGQNYTLNFFENNREQELVLKYWKMLAHRYAKIPNEYLSFNLMNEPEPPSAAIYKEVFKPIVEAIREESPNRVLIADVSYGDQAKRMAELGVALSYHFYSPGYFTYFGMEFFENDYPKIQNVKIPSVFAMQAIWNKRPLTISGEFDNSTIKLYILGGNSTDLIIRANNKQIIRKKIDQWTCKATVDIKVPPNTNKIEVITSNNNEIFWGYIEIKNSSQNYFIYPHDMYANDFDTPSGNSLKLNNDGSVINTASKVADMQYYYDLLIKPLRNISKEHKVGFMIGEFGLFGCYSHGEAYYNYYQEVYNILNDNKLPWCLFELVGDVTILCDNPNYIQQGARPKKLKIETSKGLITQYVDERLLDILIPRQ